MTQRVGLVFVSHSEKIAAGLIDLARQMAPNVVMLAAGGTAEGGLGTNFEKISSCIQQADAGVGVVILCDLGSAILTAETALDFLDDAVRGRTRIADAPLVEGGVAAAVEAETGGNLESVLQAAHSAGHSAAHSAAQSSGHPAQGEESSRQQPAPRAITRTVTLINRDGLHARPAAEFVKLANTFDAQITVNGTDARSLLAIMSLGLAQGSTVEIASEDSDAEPAVTALAKLVESGFGEK